MEIIKEIRLSTASAECYNESKTNFHVNVNGSLMNLQHRNMYVIVKDIFIPKVVKSISFELFVGKRSDEKVMRKFEIKYSSFQQLCLGVTWCGKQFGGEKGCSKGCTKDGSHDKHICDGSHDEHICDPFIEMQSLRLTYVANSFLLTLPAYYVCAMSCNLADLCGFNNLNSSKTCIFDDRSVLGNVNDEFLNREEKLCHFVFHDLPLKTFYNGDFYSILFSYNMLLRKCEEVPGLKMIKDIEDLRFSILNDDMHPYEFYTDLKKTPISFTLVFCSPM